MSTYPILLRRLAAVVLTGLTLLLAGLVAAGPVTAALRAMGVLAADRPANDDFTAAALVAGDELIGTTANAGTEAAEVAAGAATAGERTVWFRWTADRSGWTTVLPAGADGGQQVRAWVGERLADLRRADTPPADAATQGTSIPALAGTTYVLSVVSPSGAGGPFRLSIWPADPDGLGNDEPAGAVALDTAVARRAAAGGAAGLLATGTTGSATAGSGEAAVGGVPAERSVWYRLTGPLGGGSVTFTATRWAPGSRTNGGLRLGLWSAGPTPRLLAGTADGPLTATLTEGTTYLVSVDGPATWFDLLGSTAAMAGPDLTPPVVSCAAPPGGWSTTSVTLACTAADAGSGLAEPATAAFSLVADVAAGTESGEVPSSTRQVCDRAANCTVAGPVLVKLDKRPPDLVCDPVPTVWSGRNEALSCRSFDTGSGAAQPLAVQRTAVPDGTEAAVTLPAVSACDRAGNCTTAGPFGPIRIDRRPPAVTCAAPPSGWQRQEVSVACTAADSGAGLGAPELAAFPLLTTVGAGHADATAATAAKSVCDLVGNCATAGPVGPIAVDLAAPVASCRPPAGWSNRDLEVPCTVTDAGSGLTGPGELTLTATLPAGRESGSVSSSSARACDQAGNCASAGPVTGLRIDKAAPATTCERPPAGWVRTSVTIACTGTDGGAGLADAGRVELTADVPAGVERADAATSAGRLCDSAGNCAAVGPFTRLRIDRRPPAVTCAAPPGGTSVVDVRLRCTAADKGSGLADPKGAGFTLRTHVPAGQRDGAAATDSREVCDAAGNCAQAGPFTASVDRTRPPPWPAPTLRAPSQVTVLAATADSRPVPVPYTLPGARDGRGQALPAACTRPPGGTFPVGWSAVACGAQDDADRVSGARFPLLVAPMPALAPRGPAQAGRGWRAVGVGFAPRSPATLELDGVRLLSLRAGGDGRLSRDFTMPASAAPGQHLAVVRGRDRSGRELLVVSPFTVVAEGAGMVRGEPVTGQPLPPAGGPPAAPRRSPQPGATGTSAPGPGSGGPQAGPDRRPDGMVGGAPALPPTGPGVPAPPPGRPELTSPTPSSTPAPPSATGPTGRSPSTGGTVLLILLGLAAAGALVAATAAGRRRRTP